MFKRAAFFMWDSKDIVFSFGENESEQIAKSLGLDQPGTMPADIRETLGAPEGAPAWTKGEELFFRGGIGTEGSFDDLDVSVDVASQRKPDDPAHAAAVSAFMQEVLMMIPTMVQVGTGINWEDAIKELAESKGVPHMAKFINVPELLQRPELAQMAIDLAGTVGAGTTRPSINISQRPATQPRPTQAPPMQGQAPTQAPASPLGGM